MSITDLMSRMRLAMAAGLVLVSIRVGDDRGQGRGGQSLRFAGPLAALPRTPKYFVDGSGKGIYLGGHQIFAGIQDNAWMKPRDTRGQPRSYIWLSSFAESAQPASSRKRIASTSRRLRKGSG